MSERIFWRMGLWIIIVSHFAFFLVIGFSRHWGYMSSINDLGVFDQVVWNTLHGNFFQTTINPFSTSINWLGFHFHPILVLFVPLYALSPSVEWFAIAQAASLAITAWPLFLLAQHIFKSEKSGVIWALAYLVNPFLLSSGTWDFHPITLAVPFIALGLLAIVKKNSQVLILSCLLILTCKEHFGLAVVGFGALWWFRHRGWKTPVFVVTLGVSHLLVVLLFVMPALSPIDTPIMFGDQLGQLSRYSWLGNSFLEIVQTMVTQPDFVWKEVLNMGGGRYWVLLVTPFLFIFPLIGLPFLLPGLGDLIANTLSANPMPRGLWAYHSVSLVPILTAATIVGVKRVSRWQKKFSHYELSGMVLVTSILIGYFFLPLPITGAFNWWAPNYVLNWPDPSINKVRTMVGSDASLSVQANVGAHFTQRQNIYLYPKKSDEMDAIVLHLASPTTHINGYPEHLRKESIKDSPTWLDGYLQMDRTDYLASIECLLSNKEYGILHWDDPWLVLSKKTEHDQPEDIQKVNQLLKKLRDEWKVETVEYQKALGKQISKSDSKTLHRKRRGIQPGVI